MNAADRLQGTRWTLGAPVLRRDAVIASFALFAAAAGCNAGRPDFGSGPGTGASTINIHLSAGTPVAGATITVYAIHDDTGQVDTQVGTAGVVGIGGPTDSSGNAAIKLSMPNYSGPVQITASGSSLSYVDPATAAAPTSAGSSPVTIQIPATFIFSSFLANFAAGSTVNVPVNLLTTLADHEVTAYAKGRHAAHPGAKSLSSALADRDKLFVEHIVNSPAAWNPTTLRTTIPALLTAGPSTLNDAAYAAFFDVALASLASSTAAQAGFPPGSTAINSITLTQLLLEDVDADAVFDGHGQGGVQIATQGTTPLQLNGQYLRIPMAAALDQWVQSKSGNASGIQQGDLISTGVYASISGDASDLFGQAPVGLYNPVDRVPPEVSLVSEPAAFVKPGTTSVTVNINATDPSGVANVWCAFGTPLPDLVRATQNADGGWSCIVQVVQAGTTPFAVWADDLAFPQNSGKDNPDPRYRFTRTITVDGIAPAATLVETLQSFRNEIGLSVSVDGAGQAVVPPQYAYAQPFMSVKNGTSIFKASSRLAWTSTPTAALLESSNPDNIPVVQYAVPFNALTDAPVTVATWSVSLDGAAQPSATGDLWASGSTRDAVLFDLPLSANLIPALATLGGPATVAVTLTLGDAAGNLQSQSGGTFTFHVIGPPLAIAEDTAFAATGDLRSAYPYRTTDVLYSQLFQSGAPGFLPENAVRLIRYRVTNPSSTSVALALPSVPAAWSAHEIWSGFRVPTGVTSKDCGDPFTGTSGDATATPATTDLISFAYNEALGLDTAPAQITASGQVIVPPAAGSSPGMITLYIARPLVPGMRTYPLSWNGARFENSLGVASDAVATSGTVCCEFNGEVSPPRCITFGNRLAVTDYNVFQDLTAGSELLVGGFKLVTQGLSGTTVVGEPNSSPTSVSFTRTIQH